MINKPLIEAAMLLAIEAIEDPYRATQFNRGAIAVEKLHDALGEISNIKALEEDLEYFKQKHVDRQKRGF